MAEIPSLGKEKRLWRLWRRTLARLYREDKVDLSVSVIDGTLAQSFAFQDQTGYSGKYHRTGTKIVDITDRDGIPLTLVFSSGNRHDYPFAEMAVKRLKVGQRTRPGVLLGDKGFDAAKFRRQLRKRGIKTNIPHRQYRKRRRRGRPPLDDQELGKHRFVVERTNSWLKSFRRIRFRYDDSLASFRGFVLLACMVICTRKLIA